MPKDMTSLRYSIRRRRPVYPRIFSEDCRRERLQGSCETSLLFLLWPHKQGAQAIQLLLKRRAPVSQPAGGGGQSRRIDAAGSHATDLLCVNKRALLEQLKMLHDGGQAHVERGGQLRDR